MSTSPESGDTPKKKTRSVITKVALGLLLLGAGGAGTFALMANGMFGGQAGAQDNAPQLIEKGAKDPYAVSSEAVSGGGDIVHGSGGSAYRTAYYTFEESFTSNLRDSAALVQLTLAASTQRDGRVLMWLQEHELAIRSQLLIDLADTPEEEILSPEGKQRLQERMTASINNVLEEAEGYGGVDKVYFRNLIVQ